MQVFLAVFGIWYLLVGVLLLQSDGLKAITIVRHSVVGLLSFALIPLVPFGVAS